MIVDSVAGVNLDGITAYRIAAGAAHTCALRSNGTARCWGLGTGGRLGRGTTATVATATGDVDIQVFTPPQARVFRIRAGCAGDGSCSGTVVYTLSPINDVGSYLYSASNTASATVNSVDRLLVLAAGQTITFGTCGLAGSMGTGDTFLRLLGPGSDPVVVSDNACGGLLSNATFTVPPGG
jgi:hypothetical protein